MAASKEGVGGIVRISLLFQCLPPAKKAGKKTLKWLFKAFTMCSLNWPAHSHSHMEKSPNRNPHTSHSSHTHRNSPPSLSLSHTSTPLKTVQNWAHRWRILISFVLIRCVCVCVFFLRAKDFACGYNMDTSHAHRSHRPIAVIVGQSYCHISGLITTAICGRQAGWQPGSLADYAGQNSFSRIFRFSLTEKMPKSNSAKNFDFNKKEK